MKRMWNNILASRSFRCPAYLALALVCLAAPLRAEQITVFAAASLKTALDEVSAVFEETTDHDVTLSYAGSAALARQISFGAPADVFLSANSTWMTYLEDQGAIVADSRFDLLGNQLVLISHAPSPAQDWTDLDLSQRLGDGFLAIGLVQSVPAGIYGKEALETLGQWQSVATQVAQTDNVRAALALVALGEAPLGIVYATDAQADDRVHIVAPFPKDTHQPIRYPAAQISESQAATDFLTFLKSPEASALFQAHGFEVLGE
ncbi:molybdate ABC transporter substrate-binding protein [Tropicibacter sp. R15_0]|nr:molybdate ABC transporter substrate-binding protein [Tropicibacter sp. R15_0]